MITSTVEGLAKIPRAVRKGRAPVLDDAEHRALYDLERLSHKRPLLLIADNLHWWDGRSLEFLECLLSPRIRSAFPFLGAMRVLAVQTPEPFQRIANPEPYHALLGAAATPTFPLSRIPRNGL